MTSKVRTKIGAKALAVASAATVGAVLTALILTGTFGERAVAVELPAVAKQMRAFKQPAIASSSVPPELAEAQERLPSPAQGRGIPGQVRLLSQDLGKNSVEIYVFPTTGGVVCVFIAERTSVATCVDSFSPATGNVQWGIYYGVGAPVTVYGLAADSVTGVQVEVAGAVKAATLRNNSFFWQSESSAVTRDDLRALLVRQAAGGVVRVNLVRPSKS